MSVLRKLEPYIGALAVATMAADLALTVIFAVNLRKFGHPAEALACASAALGGLSFCGILFIGFRRLYYKLSGKASKSANWRIWKATLEVAVILIIWSLSAVATFIWMICTPKNGLPSTIFAMSTQMLVIIALIVWAVSGLAHTLYMMSIATVVRKGLHTSQRAGAAEEGQAASEMAETSNPTRDDSQRSTDSSTYVGSAGSTSTRSIQKRLSTESRRSSFRYSFHNAIRPMTSKTHLIGNRNSLRRQSRDSFAAERDFIDSFDSWDTSTVEGPAWESTLSFGITCSSSLSSVPHHPRILETIPASPTASSRSQSPGYPLDIQPPPSIYARHSRSQSPAASFRDLSGSHSPVGSEKHIHPLFRSDSPTPPPAATPSSILTAAPNAGVAISEMAVAVVRRKRSSSQTGPSPLIHTTSLDNIAWEVKREIGNIWTEVRRESRSRSGPVELNEKNATELSPVGERGMTPPIPEWILGAGQRTSFHGYAKRKSDKGEVAGGG
ncbi:hypothetical protein V495_04446 [Pseudogymnoascus sp. VKM F-4514 (FW-929)]|nr:hypothetical protein V495_04446 [Pseudogymnoascus sp. VKM F-4514 (FW-929)]KFY57416.1 hypothetical protein V497_05558 [Pseudogymnoascus sp. VKM F-4516 (FW-969)]